MPWTALQVQDPLAHVAAVRVARELDRAEECVQDAYASAMTFRRGVLPAAMQP